MLKIALAVALSSGFVNPSPSDCQLYAVANAAQEIRAAGFQCETATRRTPLDENFVLDENGKLDVESNQVAYYCDGPKSGQWFKLSSDLLQFKIAVEPMIAQPETTLCPSGL